MFLRISLLLLCVSLFYNCDDDNYSQNEYLKSDFIISKDSFADLISDLAIAENALNINVLNVNISKYDSAYRFNPLLLKGVSKIRFDSTVNAYSCYPKVYREVYEEVLENLNRKKIQQKSESKDSLKK